MNTKQRLELRRSEVSQQLADLSGKDELTAEDREQMATLTAEVSDLETRWRAAEAADRAAPPGLTASNIVTGGLPVPNRDLLELRQRAKLGRYIEAALEQRAVTGAEAEYAQAMGAAEGRIPLEMLATQGPVETRQTQTSDITGTGPTDASGGVWRPVLDRVFNTPVVDMIGITKETVPASQPVWPVATAGASPVQIAEAADHTTVDDLSLTITALSPIRLTATMEYTGELATQFSAGGSGIEEVLRRDMAMAFSDEMERQILVGNGTAPNVSGLTHGLTLATNPTAATSYQEYSSLAASSVEGRWASSLSDVRILMPPAAYVYGASLYETTNTTDTALQMLMRQSGGIMVSAHLPRNADNPAARANTSDLLGIRNRPMTTWAVCPVWDSFSVIRDQYTKATSGITRLIGSMYWNFEVIRSEALVPLAVRLS